jgi:hypothetical protein
VMIGNSSTGQMSNTNTSGSPSITAVATNWKMSDSDIKDAALLFLHDFR